MTKSWRHIGLGDVRSLRVMDRRVAERRTIFALTLLSTPLTVYASDAALVVVPALNLFAIGIVGLAALLVRLHWRARALAVVAAMAAAGIVWFIPNAWLPTDARLGPFLMLAAFLPPLFAGVLVIWWFRHGKSPPTIGG